MRTIDEVIFCLEDRQKTEDWNVCDDAIQYLREFNELAKMWNDKLDKEQENPPLTWDELKTMRGKPVWVERPEWKEWLLISEIDEDKCEIYLRDKWGNGAIVNARNIGYWQAYRKEK